MSLNLGFLGRKKYNGSISNINIYWKNSVHALPGMKLSSRTFNVEIPFANKNYEEFSFLKKATSAEAISDISVKEPFKLVLVEPKPPVEVEAGNSLRFKLTIEAPDYSYYGPLVIKMEPKKVETVHIEMPEIIAVSGSKRVKVNEHGEVKNVSKGGVFEVSMQMYRVLTYNDTVKAVSVSKPFEFVASEPKLPFTIDNKSSFVASFYIKAPEFDYAGTLELIFETQNTEKQA